MSTSTIKKLIPQWAEKANKYYNIPSYYKCCDNLECECNEIDGSILLKDFLNPNKWSRTTKEKLPNKYVDVYDLMGDVHGDETKDSLVERLRVNNILTHRVFGQKNDLLGDNFRLEVYSSEDDSEIISWCFIVD